MAEDGRARAVARFEGAREGVKEFVWRTRGGDQLDNGARCWFMLSCSFEERTDVVFDRRSRISTGHLEQG